MTEQELKELINPGHTAVVVIDLQNDFCHSEGDMAKSGRDVSLMQQAAHNTQKFLPEVRKRKVPVIFVRARQNPWNISPAWMRKRGEKGSSACKEGEWGEDFFVVKPDEGEAVVVKHRYSAFIGTDLDLILRSQGIQTVILTGVGTHVCVESTARDGFQMDYDIVLLSDCTGSCPPESHNRALEVLGQHFAHVVTSKEILEAWGKG